MWNRKVFIRIIELLLCISCVVALRVTEDESRRVFHFLRNRSLEWSLVNNVTWGSVGAALATATCGGYIVVTAGLLLAAASGELRGRKTEIFMLGLGVILFGIVGALSLASIDSVPGDLIDNAAVLGVLCLVTGLVFIADMLMSPRYGKKKSGGTQTASSKEQVAKQYVTTTTMTINSEKEPARTTTTATTANRRPPTPEMREKRSSANDSATEEENDDREHRLERAERQMREYARNVESGGRGGRGNKARDHEDMGRKMNGYYRNEDVYQRPADEVDDAPPFPTNGDTPVFPKVINPGVKIMRVERDDERGYDNYRYSDSSQYDNVPTRMRGSSPGILKKQRDVSFADPRRSHDYRPTDEDGRGQQQQQQHRAPRPGTRDEIEMLEECFDALRTSTTTITKRIIGERAEPQAMTEKARVASAAPVSANDPGFVRHAANNWPQILKANASGNGPEREQSR